MAKFIESKKITNQYSLTWWQIILLIFVILSPMVPYFVKFYAIRASNNTSDWGIFGDYISGTVGTLFSLLSVILIYITYRNQASQVSKQQFENTFFHLLDIYKETINHFEYESDYPYVIKESYDINPGTVGESRVPPEYGRMSYKVSGRNNIYNINNKIKENEIEKNKIDITILDEIYKQYDLMLPQFITITTQILINIDGCKYIIKSDYQDIFKAIMTEGEKSLIIYFVNYPKIDPRLKILNTRLEFLP